ncbi:DUF1572 family protein [Halobacillus sp. A5]|uniref:DUF1572 family protein n=1 Tax=Halobacillus sp. A5 TaxID=2880263 RepID=UPI003532450D
MGAEYLYVIRERFKEVKGLGDKTIQQLSEEEIYWSPNQSSNSTAVIMKHVSGNMISRWTDFLTTDGEKNNRKRDQEFIDDRASKQEMISTWDNGWKTLFHAIDHLDEENLLQEIYIRGEAHTVIEAVERQLAHYSYHVGQMVYVGKLLKEEEWESLSIPKGKSDEYLQDTLKRKRESGQENK